MKEVLETEGTSKFKLILKIVPLLDRPLRYQELSFLFLLHTNFSIFFVTGCYSTVPRTQTFRNSTHPTFKFSGTVPTGIDGLTTVN
jgi:hypothetical protein